MCVKELVCTEECAARKRERVGRRKRGGERERKGPTVNQVLVPEGPNFMDWRQLESCSFEPHID